MADEREGSKTLLTPSSRSTIKVLLNKPGIEKIRGSVPEFTWRNWKTSLSMVKFVELVNIENVRNRAAFRNIVNLP